MSCLRREDELKLKELTELAAAVGRQNLPEDDQLVMLYLEDRFNRFLEEGLRRLRGESDGGKATGLSNLFRTKLMTSLPRRVHSVKLPESQPPNANKNLHGEERSLDAIVRTPNERFVTSPPRPAAGKLWTWVLDDLAVGGVPHSDTKEDGAGHMLELWRQCLARGGSMLLVVSCLEVGEVIPPGFATLQDWERFPGVVDYYSVPFIPPEKQGNPPRVETEILEVLHTVCKSVYSALPFVDAGQVDTQKKLLDSTGHCSMFRFGGRKRRALLKFSHQPIVYIMCKTGLTRAWVFAMAYLMSQYGMGYPEAEQLLHKLRPFHPSPTQVEMALTFSTAIKPRHTEGRSEEHRYLELLAQVLSLSPSYRSRLLCDLKRST
ncbi:hypothetical protein TraAM80_04021 [Trypanosoma rangeli]|uniref:Uncharacterized protein n=1 Tax=Trypanosoma rangeli TaxID=5698 RepID=A0A3R7MQC1_TRYRA|nr:uncharacterized protein TraAM80_04021 [Trypanosoma rangeli]RNF06515.1 hypothetical protein TraAM80_04021 [Trypanosoma rangeli]|eukprot:RNF06515.1 hypothetical protein TraAM80_04021 [Trypanosoma rangeli]